MRIVKVTTAAELEQMTMVERQAHLEASIEPDLTNVPEAFLERIRTRLRARIAAASAGE